MKYLYPCTQRITADGFGEFLEKNLGEARRNINLFSEELKTAYGVPNISLVNSGSSANLAASLALAEKIKKSGKPLKAAVSAFTFPTTVSSLILAGFEIRIIDVEPDGFNMDVKELEKNIDGLSLIAVTHFLGFPADMKRVSEIARENGCLILQDACETLDLRDENDCQFFSYGDITTWSFYHPHHLSSYGGGAVITLNQDDAMLVDSICHWGRSCKCHIDPSLCTVPNGPAHQFTYERLGVNVEISELNACFGRWEFQKFNEYEKRRKENYTYLYNALSGVPNVKVYEHPAIGGSVFVFPVKITDGRTIDDAYRYFFERGLEIRTFMGGVTNEQKAFAHLSDKVYPMANDMEKHSFFVGIHQTLTLDNIIKSANILVGFFTQNSSFRGMSSNS